MLYLISNLVKKYINLVIIIILHLNILNFPILNKIKKFFNFIIEN